MPAHTYPCTHTNTNAESMDRYQCCKCKDILRSPVKLAVQCGHRFCGDCVIQIRDTNDTLCPGQFDDSDDQSTTTRCFNDLAASDSTVQDLATERDLRKERKPCPHPGCGLDIPWIDLSLHIKECGWALRRCPNDDCSVSLPAKEMQRHSMLCEHRLCECDFCESNIKRNLLEEHTEGCKDIEHVCRAVGCTFIGRGDILLKHKTDAQAEHDRLLQMQQLTNQQHQLLKAMNNLKEDFKSVLQRLGQQGEQLQKICPVVKDSDLRFRLLETANYNGELLWKISNYRRRKMDAVSRRTLSVYSQPFYTSIYGYKMCARVYLNGDGMGKGSHLSIYFVVMRGEYDVLLPWPFKQRVTLYLLDVTGSQQHIKDTFRPDPQSSSFRRPVGDMNVASGSPLFAAQSVVESSKYLNDDTIYIRVSVDLSGLSA